MILVDFCGKFHDFGWFFAIRIRFIEVDPDPADQNKTDPDPQHYNKDNLRDSHLNIEPRTSFINTNLCLASIKKWI